MAEPIADSAVSAGVGQPPVMILCPVIHAPSPPVMSSSSARMMLGMVREGRRISEGTGVLISGSS